MKKLYEEIVEQYPYCQLCGKTNNLHIHHILYGKLYNSRDKLTYKENLIRLCVECHNKVHSEKKKWQKILQEIVKGDE